MHDPILWIILIHTILFLIITLASFIEELISDKRGN